MFNPLKRNSLNRLIFLLPVRIGDELLPEDKVRMLCCTAKADLVTTLIARSTFEIIKSFIRELERGNKSTRYWELKFSLKTMCQSLYILTQNI